MCGLAIRLPVLIWALHIVINCFQSERLKSFMCIQ